MYNIHVYRLNCDNTHFDNGIALSVQYREFSNFYYKWTDEADGFFWVNLGACPDGVHTNCGSWYAGAPSRGTAW